MVQFHVGAPFFRGRKMSKLSTFVEGVPVEPDVYSQVSLLEGLSFVKRLALMPDCHVGSGSTVGTVIATDRVIIPATVGVDIGCGMTAVKTNLKSYDLPESLTGMRSAIEAAVPHGGPGIPGSWKENGRRLPGLVKTEWAAMAAEYDSILDKSGMRLAPAESQLGTLGTGNHFIEVCLDKDESVWIMLHSGSRGLGNTFGSHFISKAKEDMRRWHINLPDENLAYIPEGASYFGEYVHALNFAQNYARVNRKIMMERVLDVVRTYTEKVRYQADGTPEVFATEEAISCHHNYVAMENHFGHDYWITRKGAVRARIGDLGIIPGSMGARSFIVRGLGNRDSLASCSHGAGRVMSRTAAKKLITVEDHARDTAGIECRKDVSVIDESPRAYKNIDDVMTAQKDLVEIVAELRQVLCVKG